MRSDFKCVKYNCNEFGSRTHDILDSKWYCSKHYYEELDKVKANKKAEAKELIPNN